MMDTDLKLPDIALEPLPSLDMVALPALDPDVELAAPDFDLGAVGDFDLGLPDVDLASDIDLVTLPEPDFGALFGLDLEPLEGPRSDDSPVGKG